MNGFAAKSCSLAGAVIGTGSDVTTRANAEYRNRQWRFSGRYTTIGERFNDELGFIPPTGVNETNVNVNRTLRPNWLPRTVRELIPHWVLVQSNPADGRGLHLRQQAFHLATSRLNYNFNTKVFVNGLLQYNTDSHQLSSNIRFNIIHRPLSDFFFVYNEHRDEHTGLLQDRSLIAKMTYMVAF